MNISIYSTNSEESLLKSNGPYKILSADESIEGIIDINIEESNIEIAYDDVIAINEIEIITTIDESKD